MNLYDVTTRFVRILESSARNCDGQLSTLNQLQGRLSASERPPPVSQALSTSRQRGSEELFKPHEATQQAHDVGEEERERERNVGQRVKRPGTRDGEKVNV